MRTLLCHLGASKIAATAVGATALACGGGAAVHAADHGRHHDGAHAPGHPGDGHGNGKGHGPKPPPTKSCPGSGSSNDDTAGRTGNASSTATSPTTGTQGATSVRVTVPRLVQIQVDAGGHPVAARTNTSQQPCPGDVFYIQGGPTPGPDMIDYVLAHSPARTWRSDAWNNLS